MNEFKKVIVTGAAGFIGYHFSLRLLSEGWQVVGVDNLNDYYSTHLKEERLRRLREKSGFSFHPIDITHQQALVSLMDKATAESAAPVVHLAAQPGVRYGLVNPQAYIDNNIAGFFSVLEACRRTGTPHLLFASSSSVYGGNTRLPYRSDDNVDHPVSLYAATKKSNELLAHVYSHTYGLPATGLRFFTVYGPWGRPDMAYYSFTESIIRGRPIDVFNNGDMMRDFTYIDDVVEGLVPLLCLPPTGAEKPFKENLPPNSSWAPYRILNIGNNQPVHLMEFIRVLEQAIGIKAEIRLKPMQMGDVKSTYADIQDIAELTGFKPKTSVQVGIPKFVQWFRDFHNL